MVAQPLMMPFVFLQILMSNFWSVADHAVEVTTETRLERLNVDPTQITVSGVSAGGFMAVQLHIAHSATFSGAGVIAGGVFGCAEGDPSRGALVCMSDPGKIEVKKYIDRLGQLAKAGAIDSPANLRNSRVFILNGEFDHVVQPKSGEKLRDFYQQLIPAQNIHAEFNLKAGHGQPTLNYGMPCGSENIPWLQDCGFDAAGAILDQVYGKLRAPVKADERHLKAFSQAEFYGDPNNLKGNGYVYIPTRCENGANRCRLHVALHGCAQSPDFVGDLYRLHAGYNEWAEANDIIVLYPSARIGGMNPTGCFDWWGDSGKDYDVKSGQQITAIKGMVDRLSGVDTSSVRPGKPTPGRGRSGRSR